LSENERCIDDMVDMRKSVLLSAKTCAALVVVWAMLSALGAVTPPAAAEAKSGACADPGSVPDTARSLVLELREDCNR
jgi:hypothetical protein